MEQSLLTVAPATPGWYDVEVRIAERASISLEPRPAIAEHLLVEVNRAARGASILAHPGSRRSLPT